MADETVDLASAWSRSLEGLGDDTLPPQQRAFLQLSRPLALVEDTALFAVPNEFAKEILETRLRPVITEALSKQYGREIRIAVTVELALGNAEGDGSTRQDPSAIPPGHRPPLDEAIPYSRNDRGGVDASNGAGPGGLLAELVPPVTRREAESRLNPKYLFESFVIGSSNRFAHAAAVAVAEAPAKAYNPLFIYGESGLGKTHLLHAIGHYVRTIYAGSKVRYVSSEEFMRAQSSGALTSAPAQIA